MSDAKMKNVIALILAGGAGSRLMPLTTHQAKPAVEIAGKLRIIDFTLSNCINSGFWDILVAVQFGSYSLTKHIARNYPSVPALNFFVQTAQAQLTAGNEWYRGTADAVYQNRGIIDEEGDFEDIAILAGDHVFAMDFEQMYAYHQMKEAKFTVCVIPVPISEAHHFGIVEVDANWRIVGFEEKPQNNPKEIPGRPGFCLASMGNYFANLQWLMAILEQDAADETSTHDFGKDIIPRMLRSGMPVDAYNFMENKIEGQTTPSWRDVGTIQALWLANMDGTEISPEVNLHNIEHWPIRSGNDNLPSFKIVETAPGRSHVRNSTAAGMCLIQDSNVDHSVLGRRVAVYGSTIEQSVLFTGVTVGYGCNIRKAIIDKGVSVPPGTSIGIDLVADAARDFWIDKESGVVVIPRDFKF